MCSFEDDLQNTLKKHITEETTQNVHNFVTLSATDFSKICCIEVEWP
jgi:hypothetical protein